MFSIIFIKVYLTSGFLCDPADNPLDTLDPNFQLHPFLLFPTFSPLFLHLSTEEENHLKIQFFKCSQPQSLSQSEKGRPTLFFFRFLEFSATFFPLSSSFFLQILISSFFPQTDLQKEKVKMFKHDVFSRLAFWLFWFQSFWQN